MLKIPCQPYGDHEPYVDCIRRPKHRIEVEEAAADASYDFISVDQPLAELGVTTYIPASARGLRNADASRFTVEDFICYNELMRDRHNWSEGTFAILKARHGLRRAVRRGLEEMQEQLLMASTALNLCRMVAAVQ